MKVQALAGNHDRNGFDCGVEALNLWLRQTALQHQAKGISRTFVAVPSNAGEAGRYLAAGYGDIGDASILGFFAKIKLFPLLDNKRRCFAVVAFEKNGANGEEFEVANGVYRKLWLVTNFVENDHTKREFGKSESVAKGAIDEAQDLFADEVDA